MQIDIHKKYQTRDGREARIYAVDGSGFGGDPVHGAVKQANGWVIRTWMADGSYIEADHPNDLDLIPVPLKRTVWVNIYADSAGRMGSAYSSRERADYAAAILVGRIACVKVTYTEGEGLTDGK